MVRCVCNVDATRLMVSQSCHDAPISCKYTVHIRQQCVMHLRDKQQDEGEIKLACWFVCHSQHER